MIVSIGIWTSRSPVRDVRAVRDVARTGGSGGGGGSEKIKWRGVGG